MTETYDAIVVGGGHSGLVGAFYLARAGWRTLLVESRDQVGGCCVTEEVLPGYRCSSIANSSHSLDPRILADMDLLSHGLRYTSPELASLTLFDDGRAFVPWPDRERRRAEVERFATRPEDVAGFFEVIERTRRVAAQMDVSFYEDPPSLKDVAARFDTAAETDEFNAFMFGSVADILAEHLDSPQLRAFFAATAVATNLVGPHTPGSAYVLLQRPLYELSLASAGHDDRNDLMMRNAAPLGGIGAVTQAMAASLRAQGADIVVGSAVDEILVDDQRRTAGVRLADGREFRAKMILSNVDPKLTFTRLLAPDALPTEFLDRARKQRIDGTSAKVHIAMKGTPRFAAARTDDENALFLPTNFRIASSIETLQDAYNQAVLGRWSRRVTVTGIMDSAIDPRMTPDGHHIMSLSVRGVPYHLAEGSWDEQRTELGEAVLETVAQHIPNLPDIVDGISVYTPLDLEREYGLLEGSGSHGDIVPGRIFDARPIPGASDYRTPVAGLYLCGVGTWPGNFMSGVTGYNASHRMLHDHAVAQTAA